MCAANALFERACELDRLGQDDAAKAAYLAYLQQAPDDTRALTNLGNLAFRTGYRSAARTAYGRAVQLEPRNLVARVNLGNALLDAGDLLQAREQYEAALALDAQFAPAHQGLSYVYARLGEESACRAHRDLGFRAHALTHVPYRGTGNPVRALVFVSAAGGNFNTEWLFDQHRFDVTRLAAEYADPDLRLPKHDVAVNAIGDADLAAEGLRAALRFAGRVHGTIVNAPQRVLETSRIAVAQRLASIPGVVTPRMAAISRTALVHDGEKTLSGHGFSYPVLLRTPGHHTGRHFLKVGDASELASALASLPGDELLAIAAIDVRSPDGFTRKYRVMGIEGKLYPVHVAISRDWKVHYATADMAGNQSHRDEDARFVDDPVAVLGPHVWAALEAVVHTLQLDYAGVDFAIDTVGRLVVFEANATMSVVPVDPGERWDYRRPAIARVFGAFSDLLTERTHRA